MREAVGLAERVSSTDANVLITGETGAGKDLLASFIHSKSRRSLQPLAKIDCATLPADLLEAELFGYERGAFTGAIEAKAGRFEAAQKGTIVLDARLVALTNVDLDTAVKGGRFREDLFYRLNVINIRVPPLRERKDDLSQLIEHFLKHYSAKHGRDVQRVSPEARAVLKAYDYPGNARELANIIERAVIVATGKRVEAENLPAGLSAAVSAQQRKAKPQSLAQLEAAYISEMLAATGGNKAECARILGISRKNLYEKIARYQLTS